MRTNEHYLHIAKIQYIKYFVESAYQDYSDRKLSTLSNEELKEIMLLSQIKQLALKIRET